MSAQRCAPRSCKSMFLNTQRSPRRTLAACTEIAKHSRLPAFTEALYRAPAD
jgi:hypothetical protein